MTEKERKYRAEFRRTGRNLHKNEYLPINLASHPTKFWNGYKNVKVDWGWAARSINGVLYIPFDDCGNPMPYEGFWEAMCYGGPI